MEINLAVLVLFPFLAGVLAYVPGRCGMGKSSDGMVSEKRKKLQWGMVIGAAVLEFT